MFIIKHTKAFLIGGTTIVVVSLGLLLAFGLPFGIDFTGGSLTEVAYTEAPEKSVLEAEIQALDLGGISLREAQSEDGRAAYILRTKDLTEPERQELTAVLAGVGERGAVERFTTVGPTIGEELGRKALVALGLVILIIICFVAFAFRKVSRPAVPGANAPRVGSWIYGLITTLALLHDVLVPTAFFSVFAYFTGAEVDVLFVMAILAILGYSVNDTIVVFDRVRENLSLNAEREIREDFRETVGRSLSQTFTRSINTSVTTLLALLALFFLGGDVTATFALVLMVGVLAGTYSSLFLASPLLVYVSERFIHRG